MAKRFTDSRKFQDPWYRKLPPNYKLLWDYLLCTCNHAGIWKIDLEMASFCIGAGDYDLAECLTKLKERIIPIGEEKWFIPKYITFQYGDINTNQSKACLSAIGVMKKERVIELLPNSYESIKDKDKDKDKNKNKNPINTKYNYTGPASYGPRDMPDSVKEILKAKGLR